MAAMRLFRLLTLFALLLAPFGMMSAHAEMGMPVAAASAHHGDASDHCGDMDQSRKGKPTSGVDCAMACSALPSGENTSLAHPAGESPPMPLMLVAALHGLNPESEPPPPRA